MGNISLFNSTLIDPVYRPPPWAPDPVTLTLGVSDLPGTTFSQIWRAEAIHATALQRARVKQQAVPRQQQGELRHDSHEQELGICRTGAFWCTNRFLENVSNIFQRLWYTRTLPQKMVIESKQEQLVSLRSAGASEVFPDNMHQVHELL